MPGKEPDTISSVSQNEKVAASFWFKVPTDLPEGLMKGSGVRLKVFVVVLRSIQRDRIAGEIGQRRIAAEAKVNRDDVRRVLKELCDMGMLSVVEKKKGKRTVYGSPIRWRGNGLALV
jgi:hypothetical protein